MPPAAQLTFTKHKQLMVMKTTCVQQWLLNWMTGSRMFLFICFIQCTLFFLCSFVHYSFCCVVNGIGMAKIVDTRIVLLLLLLPLLLSKGKQCRHSPASQTIHITIACETHPHQPNPMSVSSLTRHGNNKKWAKNKKMNVIHHTFYGNLLAGNMRRRLFIIPLNNCIEIDLNSFVCSLDSVWWCL